MVENFDDLLHCLEIENQQASKSKVSKRIQTVHRSELSPDVNDILSLDLEHSSVEAGPSETSANAEKVKCCPTLIGGTVSALAHNSLPTNRTCLALHCRDCDFPVSSFPDYQWTGNVEYLFLRTNMPDFRKVLQKLTKKIGTVAYACHCVSFSTEKLQPVHETALPWFCRGHI